MLQNVLDNCCNGPILLKASKILIFSILLTIVISEYALEIYTKFHDKATVFISSTTEMVDFPLPIISICTKNQFKPTVLEKYGLDSWFDFYNENRLFEKNLSVWDTYVEASYLLNREFEILMLDPLSEKLFSVGKNYFKCENIKNIGSGVCKNGSTNLIEINEYYTMNYGTCYDIKSKLQIPPSKSVSMMIYVNESLQLIDYPEVRLRIE